MEIIIFITRVIQIIALLFLIPNEIILRIIDKRRISNIYSRIFELYSGRITILFGLLLIISALSSMILIWFI